MMAFNHNAPNEYLCGDCTGNFHAVTTGHVVALSADSIKGVAADFTMDGSSLILLPSPSSACVSYFVVIVCVFVVSVSVVVVVVVVVAVFVVFCFRF